MSLARCPWCDCLVGIQPTAKAVGEVGTARRWRLVDHNHDVRHTASGVVIAERCEGAGKLV